MPLPDLPRDPEPSEAELAVHAARVAGNFPGSELTERQRRFFAETDWRREKRLGDPDAFHVPFSGWVPRYDGYRETSLWRRISRRVLEAAGRKCAGCPGKADQVHHRDYRPRVLSGDDTRPLVPLCPACHHHVHHDGRGRRKSWQEEERTLAEIVAREDARLSEFSN